MIVVIELDEKYAGVLTLTAIGSSPGQTNVSTTSADLTKHNLLRLGSDGNWTEGKI